MTDEQTSGIVGVTQDLGGRLISSLPAQFLLLCIINCIFVLGLLWFLEKQNEARERLLGPIVTSCLQEVPNDLFKELLERKDK
jgi:hypothetical protein